MKFVHTIRAINSPADDIRVEVTSMFGAQPSAHVSISRHGVPESTFTLYELGELSVALDDARYQLQPKRASK